MEFYLIFSSILPPVYPLGKEYRLAGRREAASKKNYLFTRVRWNLLHFPLINPGRPRVCQTILRSGVPQGRGVGCIHRCPTPLSASLPIHKFEIPTQDDRYISAH